MNRYNDRTPGFTGYNMGPYIKNKFRPWLAWELIALVIGAVLYVLAYQLV